MRLGCFLRGGIGWGMYQQGGECLVVKPVEAAVSDIYLVLLLITQHNYTSQKEEFTLE